MTGAISPSRVSERARTPEKLLAMRVALREQLSMHQPSDTAEARSHREILRFLSAASDPFSRATSPGHITGSAIIVQPHGSAVLLVRHKKLNRWLQPGGHVHEEDESVFGTAVRETAEETGHRGYATPYRDKVLHVGVHEIPARPKEAAHLHYDIRYLLTANREAPRIDEGEIIEAEWFEAAALEELGLDASLQRAIAIARRVLTPEPGG